MKRFAMALMLALAPALPAAAQTFVGYTNTNANLRAGPDSGYPRVTTIPYGAQVVVYGCVQDWAWCDTDWNGQRGWVAGAYIDTDYQNSRVHVVDYGARIGWPILTFGLSAYWYDHYRRYNWYHDHDRWEHYRPPPRPPMRPPQHRPPGGDHRPPGGDHRPPTNNRPPAHKPPSNNRPPAHKPPAHKPPSRKPTPHKPAARPHPAKHH